MSNSNNGNPLHDDNIDDILTKLTNSVEPDVNLSSSDLLQSSTEGNVNPFEYDPFSNIFDDNLDESFSLNNMDQTTYSPDEFNQVVQEMENSGYFKQWDTPKQPKPVHDHSYNSKPVFEEPNTEVARKNMANLLLSTFAARKQVKPNSSKSASDVEREEEAMLNYLARSEIDAIALQVMADKIDTNTGLPEMVSTIAKTIDEVVEDSCELYNKVVHEFSKDEEITKLFSPSQLAVNYFDYQHSLYLNLAESALGYPITPERRVAVETLVKSLKSNYQSVREFTAAMEQAKELFPEGHVNVDDFIEQLRLEHIAIHAAIEKYKDLSKQLTEMGKGAQMKPAQKYIIGWFEPLRCVIEKELQLIDANVRGPDRKVYGPYLSVLGASELACITLHEILNRLLAAPSGVRFIEVALAVGKAVNTEVNLLKLRQDKKLWSKLNFHYPGKKLTDQIVMSNSSRLFEQSHWSDVVRAKVGSVLVHLLVKVADTNIPGMVNYRPDNAMQENLVESIHTPTTIVDRYQVGENVLREELSNYESFKKTTPTSLNTGARIDIHAPQTFNSENADDVDGVNGAVDRDAELELGESKKPQSVREKVQAQYNVNIDELGQLILPPLVSPAFEHSTSTVRGHQVGMISCHQRVLEAIEEAHEYVSGLSPRLYPMVIPPRPWSGLRDGGYLTVPTTIVRSKGSTLQIEAVANSHVPEIYDSLNKLGRVKWKVNTKLLNIVKEIWNAGGGIADVPSKSNIPTPQAPQVTTDIDLDGLTDEERDAKKERIAQENKALKQWQKDVQAIVQMNCDMHSLRCDMQLKLDQAERIQNRPIYFPVNLDFRGRAYPIPPHLNHLGSDLARGLLSFYESKPLGKRGLYWLYAHLASQFGVDKVSFDDRVAFAKKQWPLIKQTVETPNLPNVPNPRFKRRRPIDSPPFTIQPEIIAKYKRREAQQEIALRKSLNLPIDESKYEGIDLTIDDGDFDGCDLPYDGEFDVNPYIPWWTTADAPWQALATCFEIYNAEMSGNPELYESCLPVHQDGSCNGLQHYAALGRDEQGGGRVNLLPAGKPQDVYTHVLNQVKILMEKDIANGNELAKMLLPHMARKVVKQTVMTSVYGVTFIGARDQILRQLKELKDVKWEMGFTPEQRYKIEQSHAAILQNASANNATDEETAKNAEEGEKTHVLNVRREIDSVIYQSAIYIARLTLSSLSTVFTGAKSIMTWLGQCAQLIAAEQQPVAWVTPLGLPVAQPYRKAAAYQVKTLMQTVTFTDDNDTLPVSSQRQKAAFPPNFVHSLDATHMMLTSRECVAKGLTFSSVHDSFWTHACDVDIMNISLRDQFVNLYSQPILENLRESFVTRFPHIEFPPLPPRGTLDLNEVKKSNYFFS